ncbi:YdcH family protein [Aliiglaciecola sp. CAU 1673]|uniref:YdcH family protein n=1 Tax=Aliiglaciecola sp. CAU 1673 TaxID=3032595 RepID=UPI0023DC85CB|nr:YdcH family protein [Aliiglaciecola sp. CAU 1673]MDF2176937.1 YdcH family protein [Aliiglaciecola sp. CAU 1673]
MIIPKHDLFSEFPQYKDQINRLRTSSSTFSHLADKYHALDDEIHRIEEGAIACDDFYLESLKKKRLYQKDQIVEWINSRSH